jgi:DNA-binding response OmpR family regulator
MTDEANGQRVLVVEDELLLAMLLQAILEDAGYTVVGPIGRLDQALQAARQEDFSLALLDVNLNGEKVFPVAEVLAERKVPFAFLTGYDRETLPPRHTAAATLYKPISIALLLGTLAALSRQRPA